MKNKPWEAETIITLLKKNHEKHGSSTVLYLSDPNGQPVSYTDLYHSVGRLQDLLMQNFNVSHIGILGENSSEWLIAYLGIVCSGYVAVPIEKELSIPEVLECLRYSDCQAVFLSEDYMDYKIRLEENGIRALSLTQINAVVNTVIKNSESSNQELKNPVTPDSPAAIQFTSGTSGKPKAVVLSHKGFVSNAYAAVSRIPQNENTVFLTPLPLYHVFSLAVSVAALLICRFTVYFSSARTLMNDIRRMRPGLILAVTSIVEMIDNNVKNISDAQRNDLFGDDFIGIISGGTCLPAKLQDEMCKKGIPVIQGYGMTECSPIIAFDDLRKGLHIGSVGQALDCCVVSVNEPDENGVGELTVCGDNLMLGYYKNPEATEQTIKDGVLYTGDLGYIDNDGYIFITGKKKNLIILSNGKNVSPEELEGKFDQFPYIREVYVYEHDGKIAGEFYLNTEQYPDAEDLLKKDMLSVNRRLPKYKNIVTIKIRNVPFEHNHMMKPLRRGL